MTVINLKLKIMIPLKIIYALSKGLLFVICTLIHAITLPIILILIFIAAVFSDYVWQRVLFYLIVKPFSIYVELLNI